MLPKALLLPVIVAPESLVVKVPDTPVVLLMRAVSPVIMAPESWLVNTPETPEIVLNCAFAPVMVVPDSVPVT